MFQTVYNDFNDNASIDFRCRDWQMPEMQFYPMIVPCAHMISYGRGDYVSAYEYNYSYRNENDQTTNNYNS